MTDLIKFLEQNSVKFINFCFTDLIGKVHSVTYNANEIDNKYIVEINTQKEIQLIPEIQTIFIDPFCVQSTAVVLCNHDSRSIAKKAYDYMLSTKIADRIQFGFEIGFSVFDEVKFRASPYNSHISLSPVEDYLNIKKRNDGSNDHYDSMSTIDPLSDLRSEILLMIKESGIENSLYHKQISPFQGSIRIGDSNFLDSVDNIQKSKHVIRNVAHSYGKTVTFMPNPIAKGEGNSLYLYHSLLKNDKNLLKNPENYSYYIGGMMKHIKAINSYANPTTNSYNRLINLPNLFLQSELSFPDPVANPYLCVAAILMAGLDGIQNKIDIIETQTARSLNEALEALDKDREFLLKGEVFTNEQIDQYIKIKWEEVKKIETAVHPVEFVHYYHM